MTPDLDGAAELGEQPDHRSRDRLGAALRHGPAGAVTGRRQHESDRAAERGVQPAERMRGDAHVQSLGRIVVPAPGRPGRRQQGVQPEPGERQRMLRQVHDRAEDVVEQVVEVSGQWLEESSPRPGVVAERGERHLEVAGQHPGATVVQRVHQVELGPQPFQPEPVQAERGQERRDDAGRVEGRAVVVEQPGKGQLGRPGPATGPVVGLQHGDLDPVLGEADRGCQTVGPATDHDRGAHVLTFPRRSSRARSRAPSNR